jgi:hypothetical protein
MGSIPGLFPPQSAVSKGTGNPINFNQPDRRKFFPFTPYTGMNFLIRFRNQRAISGE